ncbi:MAG TPA: adenylosuccinate synthase [Candidatus Gallimonas intestinigallinarum]|uniref:Adenylosuccinate synthetase n=1 Tax=Candidatus Gallimonas intestinigallinarum TaxID=2838604 RepID=A0A9D2IVQ8_9FIRM|nr:adenylosuccinate synthase [Candidatus Gallimonas intestinigallinarum]
MLTSICGINWGDEGKGRMVDLLSEDYDIVCRYQGGNNAGHTVINERGKFILNLLPSGILREGVVNVLGNGMVVDIKHLTEEAGRLRAQGIRITPENLRISDKAVITMPYHVLMDCLEEERLADKKFGSTRRGIAPVYADKYMKKAFRIGELLHPERMYARVRDIVEWKNLTVEKGYGHAPITAEEVIDYLKTYGEPLKDYICDVGLYLNEAHKAGKRIMFEAQLGALRDIDFGIYPYTSSSSTIAAYAPIGAGVPNLKLDKSVGIMKAYSTCVGEGPFTAEYFGEKAEKLRAAGGEYGAATGRPRRVGPFDVVASRYGIRCQGSDEIALTKLDVLSEFEELEICTAYDLNGKIVHEFPFTDALDLCKPVFERVKGWHCDITSCRKFEELPRAAQDYVLLLEKLCECNIKYISVGAEREQIIIR